MKQGKFTVEQIIKILKENEAGVKVVDLCRKYGFSDATYYNWKSKYGGMEASDAKRLKHLEDENNKLKKLVAELTLDKMALEHLNSKKW
jgi:putative transposase